MLEIMTNEAESSAKIIVNGVMRRINEEKMMPQDTEKIIREIYKKALDRVHTEKS